MTLFSTEYLSKMLKAEILATKEYTGWEQMGPEFEAVVTDILHSDTVASVLLSIPSLMQGMGGTLRVVAAVAEKVQSTPDGNLHGRMGEVVKENLPLFGMPLSLFYWGLKIGKQLAQQEAEMVSQVSKPADTQKYETFVDRIHGFIDEYQQNGFATMAMDLQSAVDDLKK